MSLHVALSHVTELPTHIQSVSRYFLANTDIFLQLYSTSLTTIYPLYEVQQHNASSGQAWGLCTAGIYSTAGRVPAWQSLVWWGLEVSWAPISFPPSRSCHVSIGLLQLSFTPIGRRAGASVRSRHWLSSVSTEPVLLSQNV